MTRRQSSLEIHDNKGTIKNALKNDELKKEVKKDFMEGKGVKGGQRDKVQSQKPNMKGKLTSEELMQLYRTNRIVQNIIDIPAEDCAREWMLVKTGNENLDEEIKSKLKKLNAKQRMQEMIGYERKLGDGFISIGVTEKRTFDLENKLIPDKVKTLDYLHSFSSRKMAEFEKVDDVFDERYGDIEYFKLSKAQNDTQEKRVHNSRILHLVTRKLEDEDWGQSIIEPMYDVIKVFDTAVWSVGQILYDYTFKVMKSKEADNMTREEKQEAQMLLDYMFRTEALAIIGEDEELKKESTNVGGIGELLEFLWEVLAGSARMPKSHILGQQAGTITGAEYDTLNYYARIAGIQENYLKPKLEYLVKILLENEDDLDGQYNDLDFEIEFNPLWKLDRKTDIEIRDKLAQIDSTYIKAGVFSADEIREERTGEKGLHEQMGFSEDEAKEIDRMVKEARKDFYEESEEE